MFLHNQLSWYIQQHLSVVSIRSAYSVYCDHQRLYIDTCLISPMSIHSITFECFTIYGIVNMHTNFVDLSTIENDYYY